MHFDYAIIGGSFDPFHRGHLHLGKELLSRHIATSIAYVPCANHHFKKCITLSFGIRLALIQKSLDQYPGLVAWDYDSTNYSGYTADLMLRLYQSHPSLTFTFVIGADNIAQLSQWYNYRWLVDHVHFTILPRPEYKIDQHLLEGLRHEVIDIPLSQISSAEVRKSVQKGLSIDHLVPTEIVDEVRRLYV